MCLAFVLLWVWVGLVVGVGVWCFSCATGVVGALLPGLVFVTFAAGFVLRWLLGGPYCGLYCGLLTCELAVSCGIFLCIFGLTVVLLGVLWVWIAIWLWV